MRAFHRCRFIGQSLVWAVLLSAGPIVQAADTDVGRVEVHLKNGESIMGQLVAEDPQSVTVRRTMRSRSGTATADIHYQRTEVDEVTDLATAYQEKAAHAGASWTAQLALAHWCADRELTHQAATHAITVTTIDKANDDAHMLLITLGYIVVGGAWIKEDDYLDSHGLARYLDKVYHLVDKQTIVTAHSAQLAVELDLADKQKSLDRLQVIIALDQKSLDADKKKSDDLDADSTDKTTKLTAAQKQSGDDQKKLDAATKATTTKTGRQRYANPSQTTTDAQKAAQQAVADDKSKIAELQKDIDKDKQDKTDITAHEKTLTEELDGLTKQLSTLTADVATATAAVDKARTHTNDIIAHTIPVPLPPG